MTFHLIVLSSLDLDLPGSTMVSPETAVSPLEHRVGTETKASVVPSQESDGQDCMTPGEQRMLLSSK